MELDYSKDKSVKVNLGEIFGFPKTWLQRSINSSGVISLSVQDILAEPFVNKLGDLQEIRLTDGPRMNRKKNWVRKTFLL